MSKHVLVAVSQPLLHRLNSAVITGTFQPLQNRNEMCEHRDTNPWQTEKISNSILIIQITITLMSMNK